MAKRKWDSSNPLWRYQHRKNAASRSRKMVSGKMAKRKSVRHYAGIAKGLLNKPMVAGAVAGAGHALATKMNLGVHLGGAIANGAVGLILKNPVAAYIGGNYAGMYAAEIATGGRAGSMGWNF